MSKFLYPIKNLEIMPWIKYWLLKKTKGSILPNEYQQVDYIESSGTQYIDTGVLTGNNIKVLAKIIPILSMVEQGKYYSGPILGARKSSTNSNFSITNGINNAFLGVGTNFITIPKAENSETMNLFYSNSRFGLTSDNYNYINNELTIDITDSFNIFIFAMNQNGIVNGMGVYKLYEFKIYNENILVRDFIPCYRKSDNVVGLYDLVNKVFYTNAGTGSFIKGADV